MQPTKGRGEEETRLHIGLVELMEGEVMGMACVFDLVRLCSAYCFSTAHFSSPLCYTDNSNIVIP